MSFCRKKFQYLEPFLAAVIINCSYIDLDYSDHENIRMLHKKLQLRKFAAVQLFYGC